MENRPELVENANELFQKENAGKDVKTLGNVSVIIAVKDYENNKMTLQKRWGRLCGDGTVEFDKDGKKDFARVVGSWLDEASFYEWERTLKDFGQACRENPDELVDKIFDDYFARA